MNNLSTTYRILLVTGLVLLGGLLAVSSHISDSALDLLPGKAVRGDLKLLQELGLVDRIFITLSIDDQLDTKDEDTFEKLTASIEKFKGQLSDTGEFKTLLYKLPHGYETSLFTVLQPHLPYLLDQEDLSAVQHLTTEDGIRKALRHDFSLLNSLAGIAVKRQVSQDPLAMTTILLKKLKHLKSSFNMDVRDGYFLSKDGRSLLFIAVTEKSLTNGGYAVRIKQLLDRAFRVSLPSDITPKVIGTLPHTLANVNSIRHDLRTLIPIATLLLSALLLLGLRSLKAFFVLMIPFLAAPAAIGITSLIYGQIGGLALGFGIVLLGIAVDFAIHLYLALRFDNGMRYEALRKIRKPILLAALTTTSVFVVLLFSQVPSHRQMATLALIGILMAVLLSYLIIPMVIPSKADERAKSSLFFTFNFSSLQSYRIPIILFWLIFIFGGVICWNGLRYKGDLRALDVSDHSIMEDEKYFRQTWEQQGEQGFLISKGRTLEEALENNSLVYSTLKKNSNISFQSIGPILPSISIQKEHFTAWQKFWQKERRSFEKRFAEIANQQGFVAKGFAPFFNWLDNNTSFLTPEKLLNSPLQPFVNSMIKRVDNNGSNGQTSHYLVLTTVDITGGHKKPLLQLDQKQGITLVSNLKWRSQVENMLRHDILTLSLSAACLIILITAITFRQISKVVAVLAPVLSALASMAIFSYFRGAELNMMHLLMGIMVIGLSVDYGIFVVCSRNNNTSKVSLIGVSICAASSLIGFGVLAFAYHPALSSLGTTVLVGIGAAWPTAVWIAPVILGPDSLPDATEKL